MEHPPDRTANVLAALMLATILVFAWSGDHSNDKAWGKMVDQIESWTGLDFDEKKKDDKKKTVKKPTDKKPTDKKPTDKRDPKDKLNTDKKGAKQPSRSDDE